MIELIFQKELMLISGINQKNVCFVIIGIFLIRTLVMDHIFVMVVLYNAKIENREYRIYFLYISKREAKQLITNSNLIDKKGVL